MAPLSLRLRNATKQDGDFDSLGANEDIWHPYTPPGRRTNLSVDKVPFLGKFWPWFNAATYLLKVSICRNGLPHALKYLLNISGEGESMQCSCSIACCAFCKPECGYSGKWLLCNVAVGSRVRCDNMKQRSRGEWSQPIVESTSLQSTQIRIHPISTEKRQQVFEHDSEIAM